MSRLTPTALAGVILYGAAQWVTFLARTVDEALADFGTEEEQ